MLKDTYQFGNNNEFSLIVYYDPEDKSPWTTVQVGKSINGIEQKKHLIENNAAVLKFILDHARENNRYVGTRDLPENWPKGYKCDFSIYRAIRTFLGEYKSRLDSQNSRNGGVCFDLSHVICIMEEPVTPPQSVKVIKEEDISSTPKDEEDNRPISPQKLWNAGHRTYEQSKADGGRFQMLHVEKRIMPFFRSDEKRTNGSVLPINITTGDSKEELSLRDALESKHGNLYLIGEGGIGKTTAMFSTIEQNYKENTYDPTAEIPLFIELNRAPGVFGRWYKGSEGMKSCFVRMEIARQVLDCEELADVSNEMIKCVTDEFKRTPDNGQPKYLLLLDGLNEVSMNSITDNSTIVNGYGISEFVRRLIIEEINYLITQCPNVRVMLTSRTDETEVNCTEHNIEKLYLTGLNKESIRKYLDSKDYSKDDIKSVLENEALVECIKIPLFLTMYADLRNSNGVTSRGEILRQFFYERGENIAYTQQKAIHNLKFNQYHLWFILDFLLPAIASEMERIGEFELNARIIGSIIEPILKGWKPTNDKAVPTDDGQPYDASVIGEYGKACFDKYTSGRSTVETVAEEILVQGRNMTKVAEYVLYNVVDVLRIMYRNKNEFGFIHHHFRDFFAAAHDVNLLRIALSAYEDEPELAFESLASFRANANHQEKSIFIGEILGEHHNKPYLKDDVWHYNVPDTEDDRNLLQRALDIFRGRFGNDIGYGAYNLIDPIKLVRQDLYKCNFINLDLSSVTFNSVYLGHSRSGGAFLNGARINIENLLCQGHSGAITCIAYEPSRGNTFLSASGDGTIKEWDIATGQCVFTYEGHSSWVRSVAYAPDGKSFISGALDNTIKEWEIRKKNCINTYHGHENGVTCVAYSPDGKSFLSCSDDKTIKEWQIGEINCICTYYGHTQSVFSVVYAPDGNSFLSCSDDRTIREWQIGESKCIRTYFGHIEGVRSIAYSTTGKTFLTGSNDGIIKEWNIGANNCSYTYERHNSKVRSIAYSPNGKNFLSGSSDDSIKEWCIGQSRCIRTYIGPSDFAHTITYSPDCTTFLSGSSDGSIKEWRVGEYECIDFYLGHSWSITSIAYAPDGKSFLSGSYDNTIKVWNIGEKECIHTYKGCRDSVTSIIFAPDGKTFLSGARDGTITEWSVENNKCICIYFGTHYFVTSLAYNPDGKSFLSGARDGTITEWRTGENKFIHKYKRNTHAVYSIAFSPDGKNFFSGESDGTISKWRFGEDNCIGCYKMHSRAIYSITFSPDSQTIFSGSSDGTTCIWSAKTAECIKIIHNYPGLLVSGCDMRNLHKDSSIDKDILRQYGAIVD